MNRFLSLAGAGLALALLAAPASAQRDYKFDEIAADAAYGLCPLFLAGQFPLTSPQLAERGFGSAVHKKSHPRFGELQIVAVKRAEGEIAFGGAPGQVCMVVVTGPGRDTALARLRETMSFMGLPFKPVPHQGPQLAGVSVDTFRAPVERQFLTVQLIQATGPTPSVSAQLFATNQ
jgi:hypothetical protein